MLGWITCCSNGVYTLFLWMQDVTHEKQLMTLWHGNVSASLVLCEGIQQLIPHKGPKAFRIEVRLNELLTHWGRVTHICISKLTIIGSDNGLFVYIFIYNFVIVACSMYISNVIVYIVHFFACTGPLIAIYYIYAYITYRYFLYVFRLNVSIYAALTVSF